MTPKALVPSAAAGAIPIAGNQPVSVGEAKVTASISRLIKTVPKEAF
jgi:hypothetical protein